MTKSHLKGNNVIITGTSKGIGRAKAIVCAETSAVSIGVGARSRYLGLGEKLRDAAKNAEKQELKALAVKLDMRDPAMVESAKDVEADFDRLDIVFENVDYLELAVPVMDSDSNELRKTWTAANLICWPILAV